MSISLGPLSTVIIECPDPLNPGKFITIGAIEKPNGCLHAIICGYCETRNEPDCQICISCGGPLNDDITTRRNKR
jgi:hypothetical protein